MKALLIALALATGCATIQPVPAPTEPCEAFCAHGDALGCSWAQPTPAGARCIDWCANTQGGPIPLDLDCSARATDCAAVDACNR